MSTDQNERKSRLLGMNFSSARSRLDRDLLFKLATDAGHVCFRCGGELTRDNFSVDHKEHWSISVEPVKAFFDLDNVAFSHHQCNSGFTTKVREHSYHKGCRCESCKEDKRGYRAPYNKDNRQRRYQKYGT